MKDKIPFTVRFKAGMPYLEATGPLKEEEENAIAIERLLMDPQVMEDWKDEFIKDHNAMLALSTHGPMWATLILALFSVVMFGYHFATVSHFATTVFTILMPDSSYI